VHNHKAGLLIENDEGYTFQYDKAYLSMQNATPVSLTLPLQKMLLRQTIYFRFLTV
jgi:serine/threonine-protein kinase HipA